MITFSIEDKHCQIVVPDLGDCVNIDLAEAQKLVSQHHAFVTEHHAFIEDKSHYLLVDISRIRSVTSEAREFLQGPEAGLKNILGAAFIASNPVAALLANIFIKGPKNLQAKFFSKQVDAMNWIDEHRLKPVTNH